MYRWKKKSYFSHSKFLEKRKSTVILQVLQRLLALSLSRLGTWDAASLRHLHAAFFSFFVGDDSMIFFNPSQQGVAGVSVFLVRKSTHGATKVFSWSQVKPFDGSFAATVKTNTSKVKNDTNTGFILIHRFISLIHSCVNAFGWMEQWGRCYIYSHMHGAFGAFITSPIYDY